MKELLNDPVLTIRQAFYAHSLKILVYTMPLPSLTGSDKPSNSDTSISPESVTNSVSSAMDSAHSSSGGSAAEEAKAGVSQTASEASKAADKLYEENIEDEYAKREGGA